VQDSRARYATVGQKAVVRCEDVGKPEIDYRLGY
jgi:hypothetical protein